MTQLVQKAVAKALALHEGQTRKGNAGTPYIVHPLSVALTLAGYTTSDELIAAAVLHDTLEDCQYTPAQLKEEFGQDVATMVGMLTEDKSIADWRERKGGALGKIRENKAALVVKAIDALANARDLLTLLKTEGETAWQYFKGSKQDMLDYYAAIIELVKDDLPAPLLLEFACTHKDLEYADVATGEARFGFAAA